MSSVLTHSIRPRVFIVQLHHSIDDLMLSRYLERNIIPTFDMFPDVSLLNADVDRFMMSSEVADLPIAKFDLVEQAITVLSQLHGVDWVIIPRPNKSELFVALVEQYEHIRYQAHLHIKHYIKFKHSFTIPYSEVDEALLNVLNKSNNLDELPQDIYSLIQRHKPEFEPESIREDINDETDEVTSEEMPNVVVPLYTDANYARRESAHPPVSNLEKIANRMHLVVLKPEPKAALTVDNQIVTHESLAHISHKTDDVLSYQKLHSSILALQDYLRTNMKDIEEFHSGESDISFRGTWHDDSQVKILAYSLNDERGHSAWYIKLE